MVWDNFRWDSPSPAPAPMKVRNMNRKVLLTFPKAEDSFAELFGTVVTGMHNNAYFVEPWFAAGEGPTWQALSDLFADYMSAKRAAVDGDKGKIAMRVALRAQAEVMLKQIGTYVNGKAAGNLAAMESSGFEISKEKAPISTLPPDAPQNLKLKHGEVQHSIVASCKKPAGNVSFETQINSGNPNLEADWKAGAFTTVCSRIELLNLTPGTIYAVRVRAVNKNGPGLWSDIASLMAM